MCKTHFFLIYYFDSYTCDNTTEEDIFIVKETIENSQLVKSQSYRIFYEKGASQEINYPCSCYLIQKNKKRTLTVRF